MRFGTMLVLAGALAMPGVAYAQDSDSMNTDPMTQPSQEPSTTGDSDMGTMGQGSDVRTGMPMGTQSNQQVDVFKNKDNFRVRGTVSSVDAAQNSITVQREGGLPPIQLQVATGTDIKMDGRQSSLNQLQPGSEVRAEFNVAQDQPVAISLDAKKSKQQKEMQRDSSKMERDAEKMQRDSMNQ